MKMKNRNGNILVYFLVAFAFVSLVSSFLISNVSHAIQRLGTLTMKNQAYFLADEVTRATVISLTKNDAEIMTNLDFTKTNKETYVHYKDAAETEYLGTSVITLTKEQYPYYDEMKWWVVITVDVEIPDSRAGSVGDKKYTYSTVTRVLIENPNIQLFYMK